MSNKYGLFWNSSSGDRTYDADSFEEWLKPFFKNGVFVSSLPITAGNGMTVSVGFGTAYINGKLRTFDTDTLLTIPNANGSYPRIDNVVVERNDTSREITLKVVQGTYSGTTAAAIKPTRANGIYQLVIARVTVAAGATAITASDITDCRADTDLCGYVSTAIENPDFEAWYKVNELQFTEWFQKLKNQLSTDVAGNLQNEINELHQSEIYDVPTTGWTDRTMDGKVYKSYEIILTNEFIPAQCTISLVASGDTVLPTAAEAAAYTSCFATLDDTTLRIYAAAIPGSTFAIAVRGVKA